MRFQAAAARQLRGRDAREAGPPAARPSREPARGRVKSAALHALSLARLAAKRPKVPVGFWTERP